MKLIHLKEPVHGKKINLEHVKDILRIKPDIILFEYPSDKKDLSYFNKFDFDKKPKNKIVELKEGFKEYSKSHKEFSFEYKIIEAIEKLWNKKQVYLFEIDGPSKLLKSGEGSRGTKNLIWNCKRERDMVRNIRKIINKYRKSKIILICHDFHWKNIKLLLKNPSQKQIYNGYFINLNKNKK